MERTGAAALIIGNEVLTAKVDDANGTFLIRRLREKGIVCHSVHLVLDDVDQIVEAVQLARKRARWVFTSGGIGPTHDDVTVRAVALALGRRVIKLPEMEARVRAFYGERLTPAAFRLAEAPEGAYLVEHPEARFPVLACDDVFILPGVPSLFRLQLDAVLHTLPQGQVTLKVIYLDASEPEIAAVLDSIALAMPHVAIGSYPNFEPELGYRVKVTVEHAESGPVDQVMARLLEELPPRSILRTE